jgi:hypothetical protein
MLKYMPITKPVDAAAGLHRLEHMIYQPSIENTCNPPIICSTQRRHFIF